MSAMPLYTFYPTLESGLSDSFTTLELESDFDVVFQSLVILDRHRSAASVVVFCGDRKVHTRTRLDPALNAVLSQAAG
jgi:hypothetical protein